MAWFTPIQVVQLLTVKIFNISHDVTVSFRITAYGNSSSTEIDLALTLSQTKLSSHVSAQQPEAQLLALRTHQSCLYIHSTANTFGQWYLIATRKLRGKWKKENILEDIKRGKSFLDVANSNFDKKESEFLKFLAESSSYATQVQTAPGRFMSR
ncbi:hypothetical protein L6164_030327 [Bauhinia variegata]|uniref:Uncharacterized protein n=1 Tax=Bauhinia variegata TaxID=167791 RepID=A0ACB9LBF6_BAUVA|nr:hypothetical protein L6164_030327 [Bauhinia variegata]